MRRKILDDVFQLVVAATNFDDFGSTVVFFDVDLPVVGVDTDLAKVKLSGCGNSACYRLSGGVESFRTLLFSSWVGVLSRTL